MQGRYCINFLQARNQSNSHLIKNLSRLSKKNLQVLLSRFLHTILEVKYGVSQSDVLSFDCQYVHNQRADFSKSLFYLIVERLNSI